jgi:hypothetical protein
MGTENDQASDERYLRRKQREADEATIRRTTGSAPSQRLFETDDQYEARAKEDVMHGNTSRSAWLWIGVVVLLAVPQSLEGQTSSAAPEIVVAIGKPAGAFTLSNDGSLLYRTKQFRPAIKVNTDTVRSFSIVPRKDGKFAGALAQDSDGQNFAFLLKLTDFSSTPLQAAGKWSAAQSFFWSPSGRYLLALCSYEGHRFVGIDVESRKLTEGPFLGSANRLGLVENAPTWYEQEDALLFILAEKCSPYEEENCDTTKTLARYLVVLSPSNLGMSRTSL